MPSTEDIIRPPSVEEELHELEREERELEARADRLSLAGGLTLAFSILALVVGAIAVTIALIANGKANDARDAAKALTPAPAAGVGQPATASGGTQPTAPAALPSALNVKLGEMFVRPDAPVVRAGKVTFRVANTGTLTHEMIVERLPVTKKPNGQADEGHASGEVSELAPGKSGKVTLNLKAGTYQLFCNVPGHYAAGQRTNITVAKG